MATAAVLRGGKISEPGNDRREVFESTATRGHAEEVESVPGEAEDHREVCSEEEESKTTTTTTTTTTKTTTKISIIEDSHQSANLCKNCAAVFVVTNMRFFLSTSSNESSSRAIET